MRTAVLLVALALVGLSAASLVPTGSAIGNCPNGWNGVLIPRPVGEGSWGFCCSPWWPMECYRYPLFDGGIGDILP